MYIYIYDTMQRIDTYLDHFIARFDVDMMGYHGDIMEVSRGYHGDAMGHTTGFIANITTRSTSSANCLR